MKNGEWSGDPRIFESDEFHERCEHIFRESGMQGLITYLFIFEHAGENATGPEPLEVRLEPGAEERFETDPKDQARLRSVAQKILAHAAQSH